MSEKPQNGHQQKKRSRNSNRRQGNNKGGKGNHRGNHSSNDKNSSNENRNKQESNKKPNPKPLTLFQRILAFFGIKPKQSKSTPEKSRENRKSDKVTEKKVRVTQKVEVTSGRLYIGNLSYETTEYDLEDLFKGNGPVKSVEIIYNRHTHKSKGYGFVEMLKIEDAKRAIDVHHDQPFMGRMLIVNGAKKKDAEDRREKPAA
jgi:RNA recognition motif-containing protein